MEDAMSSKSPPMIPAHITRGAEGLCDGEPIAQYEIGEGKNFVYLIVDWKAKQAAIVDPQQDLREPLQGLRAHGLSLERVLLTHTHSDHTAGLRELLAIHPGLAVHCHPADAFRLERSLDPGSLSFVNDGQLLPVGSSTVKVLHTPGHSAGACCFLLESEPPYLLSGDTLFIRDCGRCDLATGSVREMFASLARLKVLPPETVVLPGHHYAAERVSTIGRELRESPPLQCRTIEELERLP
jgi:glyoxylase-like metal-dependent hydrolase (beta-lactamase superfamily II)